ncbi:PIN domain-containing protein [Burkholderia glumae]|uniref:PIN domain-containing protein n=1 Tax=Burkholderia glumae TaxID=337 RepID=UPI0005687B3F|nr:PIN domain-containing protein [Burkholderia glumae]
MSIPTVVFLDTSVLAGQQFNFASTAFMTFVPAAKKAGLKLVLPDPTEREVKRQIKERSQEALDALELARKRAPFLEKWTSFPRKAFPSVDTWEVTRIATDEWNAFLSQFSVVRLGYELLDVKAVMNWYDYIVPPFREGKKRKEFPDAFAISMVDTYADKNRCFVAVVSDDQDFKLACERFPKLLYFKSLPRLTERLLPAEDDVEKLHAAIDADIDELLNAVSLEIEGLNFHHYDRRFELDESNISVPSIHDLSVVAIGESECTVTFEVEIEAQHKLQWDEYNGPDERPDRVDGWILETVNVEGTAKLLFDPKTNALTGVPYVCLDAEDIEVSATPRRW